MYLSIIDGYKPNPDKEVIKTIMMGIKKKNGYCPCKVGETEDNKCPCASYRNGEGCICGLYVEDK